jgi:putative hydrolase of the HAD superfamily
VFVKFRAVGVDAVGTLIRPREPVGACYARLARAHGVEIPAWRLEDAFRRALRAAPPMAFPGEPPARVHALERAWWHGVVRVTFRAADQTARFPDFEAFFAALFAHFARPCAWHAAPGAAAALAALAAAGRRVAVLSNFDQRLPAILAGLGLDAPDGVLLPAELGAAKPDPRFFASAAAHLGVAPTEAVYVGDDPELDLAAARRAGWQALDAAALATLDALPVRIDALEAAQPPEDPRR